MDRSIYAAIAPVTLLWCPVPKELQSEQSVGLIPAEKCQVPHSHGRCSYFAAQENSAEDTCAINTSSSSSSLGLHSKLLAWLPGAGVLGMEVRDPGDPPHNQAKFEALPLLGSDQGTGPSSEQMGRGRAESEKIVAGQAEQKHGCGEVSDLSDLCLCH